MVIEMIPRPFKSICDYLKNWIVFVRDLQITQENGFESRPKVKTNFINKINKPPQLAWAEKYYHLTVDQWRQRVFFDKTRVNMLGSGGGDILALHLTEPHIKGDGGDVLF
jgi:hypothetical protein